MVLFVVVLCVLVVHLLWCAVCSVVGRDERKHLETFAQGSLARCTLRHRAPARRSHGVTSKRSERERGYYRRAFITSLLCVRAPAVARELLLDVQANRFLAPPQPAAQFAPAPAAARKQTTHQALKHNPSARSRPNVGVDALSVSKHCRFLLALTLGRELGKASLGW